MNDVIINTVNNKNVAYLRELQVTLEDYFIHEDTKDGLEHLSNLGLINTDKKWTNRWYFPINLTWDDVSELAAYKKELMTVYIKHPINFVRRGVIYDDYSEMLVEDALIKTGYVVVSKNAHYFNGKEYHQNEIRRPGRKRDLDYIVYDKENEVYIGMQIKNRLECPKIADIHQLLDLCNTLDLIPVLVTRLAHPNIYAIFDTIRGEVIQTKRYFKQPPFPRESFKEIIRLLKIPLGVYQWTPDFLINRFIELREKIR